MNTSPPAGPAFGLGQPTTDFEALIDGRRSPLRVYELDLSTAHTFGGTGANAAVQLRITGNSFFIDQAPDVGNAYVIFEGVQDDTGPNIVTAVYVQPGFVSRVPFANVRIANTAQAGKKLRIIYGVDVDFLPSVNASVAVSGSVNAINYGAAYGAAYKSTTAMAANTPDTVFAPASNVNGAIVWSACAIPGGVAAVLGAFVAKTSAPANVLDGDVIHIAGSNGATYGQAAPMANPVFIAAGKGLYWIPNTAESGTQLRQVLYTLL